MRFLTVAAVSCLTLLVTNVIDSVNGMPASSQTNFKPPNAWKVPPRSYAAAVELGPRPLQDKGALSKIAIQNQKKREKKKMKKASEASSHSESIWDLDEETTVPKKSDKIIPEESKTLERAQIIKKLKTKSIGESSILDKSTLVDQSMKNKSAIMEDFPTLSPTSQKSPQPKRMESKIDEKQIKNKSKKTQEQKSTGESSIFDKSTSIDQSTKNKSSITEDLPTLSSTSQKSLQSKRMESKIDGKQIRNNKPKKTQEQESTGESSILDKSISVDQSIENKSSIMEDFPTPSPTSQESSQPKKMEPKIDEKQIKNKSKKTQEQESTGESSILDQSISVDHSIKNKSSIMEDFPTLSSTSQKSSQPKRMESKIYEEQIKKPKRTQEQKLVDTSSEHLEGGTFSTEAISEKQGQDKPNPSVLTSPVINDGLGKTELKSNEKKTETLPGTQSQKSEGKQPAPNLERKTSLTKKGVSKVDLTALVESLPGLKNLKFQEKMIKSSQIKSEEDKSNLYDKKREPYQPNKLPSKPSKYFEETASQVKSSTQGKTERQFYKKTSGSSTVAEWRSKQEVVERSKGETSKISSFPFINKEACPVKTKSDKFKEDQSFAQSSKNFWQKREFQKSEKNETMKDALQEQNYSQTSSLDKESSSQQTEHSELKQTESSLQEDADISSLQEDISSKQKIIQSTNKEESSNGDANSSQTHLPLQEKAGPSKDSVDHDRKRDTKEHLAIQTSKSNEANIISPQASNIQPEVSDITTSIHSQTQLKQDKEIKSNKQSSGKSLNSKIGKMELSLESEDLSVQTKNNILSKPSEEDEAAHLNPTVAETLISDSTELIAPTNQEEEKGNNEIKLSEKKQELSTNNIASTLDKINSVTKDKIEMILSQSKEDTSSSEKYEKKETSQSRAKNSKTDNLSLELVPKELSNNNNTSPELQIFKEPKEEGGTPTPLTSESLSNVGESVSDMVIANKLNRSFLSLLEDAGIFHSDEKNKQKTIETKSISKFSIKIPEKSIADEHTKDQAPADSSQNQSKREVKKSSAEKTNTPKYNRARKERVMVNTLLITCIYESALEKLEQSAPNPMIFGAIDVVTLRGSGVIVKFDSNARVHDLQDTILETRDLGQVLQTTSTYFSEYLLCIHDIPNDVLHFQMVYKIKLQYNESPMSLHFVSYTAGLKDNYKIALFDVSDSLWNNVKKNPLIQVRWMWRRIELCLSPNQGDSPLSAATNLMLTSEPFTNYAFIFKVPKNITLFEINWSIFKKYNEKPYEIQFSPYIRTAQTKIVRLKISETLLKKIFLSPNIQLRWSERLISTSVAIERCTKCQLLGHFSSDCLGNERPPPSTHENCLDCSSHHISDIKSPFQPPNAVHETDGAECPTKLAYITQFLSDINKNRGSESRGDNSPKQPQQLRQQREPTSASFSNASKIGNLNTFTSPITHVGQTSFTSKDNISQHSVADISKMESATLAQANDLCKKTIDSFPYKSIDDMISDHSTGPKSSSDVLKKQIISEAVRQTVCETLNNVLPLFYETIIEAVDQSVQESLNRLLPTSLTPSASFKTCNSQDLSSGASDDPQVVPEDRGKGKEKVSGDNIAEYVSAVVEDGGKRKAVLFVRGQSEKIDVYEELVKLDISWKLALLEHTVQYPRTGLLLVCSSTEGAEYLRGIIKKSPNLEILM